MFEHCGRTDDDEGRTPEHGHTISSPCEPEGSGELKWLDTIDYISKNQ